MILTFERPGHGHILCPLVDYVDVMSEPVPCGQYFERYCD